MILPFLFPFFTVFHEVQSMESSIRSLDQKNIVTEKDFYSLEKMTFDSIQKEVDEEGNTFLHTLSAFQFPNIELIKSLVVDRSFSVLVKNSFGEDPWEHGMKYHKDDRNFFIFFDLLYHGPTKTQWDAYCGETLLVHDALDASPDLLFEKDQRGFPLVYYAWNHKTLLRQLLEKDAFSDAATYQKVVMMWLFRAQQEAKCGRIKEHKKMVEAIKIAFNSSPDFLRLCANQFLNRAVSVDSDLLPIIFKQLPINQYNQSNLIEALKVSLKRESKKYFNDYYSALLQKTASYLADA